MGRSPMHRLLQGMRIKWDFVLKVQLAAAIMQHSFAFSAFTSKPMNTVSVVGNKTKIECSRNPHPSHPVNWEFSPPGSKDFSRIYVGKRITENLSTRYKIDTDNITRYDIVIDSVDMSDAGTYRCMPIADEEINASAELIVIASDPVCGTNKSILNGQIAEYEYIQLLCAVNYTGNWIPAMEWMKDNELTVDADVIYTNTSTNVASSLTIQLIANDNGVSFTSKTTFKRALTSISRPDNAFKTFATNIPQYQYFWNFKFNVLYAPRDLIILPMNSGYKVGDRLVCSANGNPKPSYKWMDTETNLTIHGANLTIGDNMISDKNYSFRCTAYNNVNGFTKQTSMTVIFTVTILVRSEFKTEQYALISMTAVGAVCCLVLALYLCNNRCPYKRGLARPDPDILQAVQINPYHRNSEQHLPIPVYAEVRRKENNNDSRSVAEGATGYLSKEKGLPVYTEVIKNRNGSKHPDWPGQTVESTASQHRSPKTHTGADGTQYMDVTSIRDLNARAPIIHPPMFSLVETYASIDHTVDAPPPPLPPKRQ